VNEFRASRMRWRNHHPNLWEYGIEILDLDPLRTLFFRALLLQHRRRSQGGPVGNYYEFGVGDGSSLVAYARALRSLRKVVSIGEADFHLFGFDTFEGLPPTDDVRDQNPEWWVGRFSTSEEEVRRRVLRALPNPLQSGLRLVKGRFETTLTPGLQEQLARFPPAIVNVDCDFYSSAKTVLDWISPMLTTGCIVYFDDFWEMWGNPGFGEPAALRDFGQTGPGELIPFTRVPTPGWGRAFVFVGHTMPSSSANRGEHASVERVTDAGVKASSP